MHASEKFPATIDCLIFDDPKNPDDYCVVINSECVNPAQARMLLDDRIANGDAFSTERCARIPAEEYERRNLPALLRRQAE